MMEDYDVYFKANEMFESNSLKVRMFDTDLDFVSNSEGVIDKVGILVKAEDQVLAKKQAEKIAKKINDCFAYLYGNFVMSEPFEEDTIKLPNGRQTVTTRLTIKRLIRSEFNLDKFEKNVNKLRKNRKIRLVSLYGNKRRETLNDKFLTLYGILIEKFGDHKKLNSFLLSECVKQRKRRDKKIKKLISKAWVVTVRDSIVYDNYFVKEKEIDDLDKIVKSITK